MDPENMLWKPPWTWTTEELDVEWLLAIDCVSEVVGLHMAAVEFPWSILEISLC